MNNFAKGLAVAVAVAFSSQAFAQTAATPGVDKRQANQEKRIDQGVKSGQITDKEAARLEKGQDRVEKMEDKAKADGKVTAKEKKHLDKAQDQQSKKIEKAKQNKKNAKPQ